MSTLTITPTNAQAAHKAADEKGKALLENLLGKEIFTPQKITDRVKTFEDAYKILGETTNKNILLTYNGTDATIIAAQAFVKLSIIAEVLNEGWQPDWTNSNERKYYPWFNLSSGFGLSYFDCDTWGTGTAVGSRLCFKTAELAKYAGTQFTDLYTQFMIIKK